MAYIQQLLGTMFRLLNTFRRVEKAAVVTTNINLPGHLGSSFFPQKIIYLQRQH